MNAIRSPPPFSGWDRTAAGERIVWAVAEEPYTICEVVGAKSNAEAPDTVRAVELVPVPGFGAPNDVAEGLNVLFHEACFPGLPRYKRV